ncbi:MAG: AMP-binding protein [Dehalococcoidia bacterium]|nr:AMP-binding protein [Dehalococcoidia bacterium]
MPELPYLQKGLEHPNKSAIIDSRGAWTYAELAENVDSAACALAGAEDSIEGERIGIFMDPSKETLAMFFGILEAGGVAVPLSIFAPARELAYQVEDAGLKRLISDPTTHAERIEETKALGASFNVSNRLHLLDNSSRRSLATPSSDAPAVMLYTSGTTGRPKGVVHSHASLINQVEVLREAWQWHDADRLLHCLPLHHVHGLINGAIGALWAGAQLRLMPKFDAVDVWRTFSSREATVFYAVPTIYHQLVEAWEAEDPVVRDPWAQGAAALRLAVSGSAALPETLFQRWRLITGQILLERYGMTEIGMAISNPYEGERRPGTVGQPLPTMDIRIVDEDGADLPPEQPGEIWVRGASLFSEYWQRPEATRDSFRDGYFMTGDIAELRNGYYRILGRASQDIIKSAGYKISALEIEEQILSHPSVSEVAVVGVRSEEWGEVITACVVLRPGESMDLKQVRDWCSDKLSAYKHPRRLELRDALPRNTMGKVIKPQLVTELSQS